MTKPFHQITVKQAVVLLIDYYGDGAGVEASRRASYARIAGHQDEYRFWEECSNYWSLFHKLPKYIDSAAASSASPWNPTDRFRRRREG